ncbi:hypothetical protein HMPREF0072_1752 [Anaerococcus lactolyticus ATCC 51172]|uniref:Lipoprotein n=1 Tax=Anaerococcus lactolyticus ATCC 51172 TaxID=525254 RepID=C2BHD2_9FIRM|nr:hypothetical protein HMPREF0072_1752 [Anaerococcus lactolyticus ATCC 51172]
MKRANDFDFSKTYIFLKLRFGMLVIHIFIFFLASCQLFDKKTPQMIDKYQ